ncbi:hypothetical protein AaE_008436, partial [Aphanomyces astaci]
QLRDMFEVPPAILLTPPPSVVDFLELLTDEVGPLFIALDEIGAAFTCDSWTDLKSRDRSSHGVLPRHCWKLAVDSKRVVRAAWPRPCWENTDPSEVDSGQPVHNLLSAKASPPSARSDQDHHGQDICRP